MNLRATSQSFGRWGGAPGTAGIVLTGLATLVLLSFLGLLLIAVLAKGIPAFSWRFVATIPRRDFFDVNSAAILPMIVGTTLRVLIMTVFVMPFGVVTAVYLSEYADPASPFTRGIRSAISNIAGVPSIVFGLFGLGFFVNFLGRGMDTVSGVDTPEFGRPSLLWASLTLAVMTLPVVIVATEESLRSIPSGLREASLALGSTKLQTVWRIVLPQALPGILTGGILAVGRAAGEVAPILFTGAAYYTAELPGRLTDQFMDLGYHVYVLATQSPNVDQTAPILYATVLALLVLTLSLNAGAILLRSRLRRNLRDAA
jgi:phosphate transport system permease protein